MILQKFIVKDWSNLYPVSQLVEAYKQ